MVEAIKNIAVGIWEACIALVEGVATMVEYVISVVEDTAWIVTYIGTLISGGFKSWLEWLPDVCASVVLGCVGIAVVYKVVGRE